MPWKKRFWWGLNVEAYACLYFQISSITGCFVLFISSGGCFKGCAFTDVCFLEIDFHLKPLHNCVILICPECSVLLLFRFFSNHSLPVQLIYLFPVDLLNVCVRVILFESVVITVCWKQLISAERKENVVSFDRRLVFFSWWWKYPEYLVECWKHFV